MVKVFYFLSTVLLTCFGLTLSWSLLSVCVFGAGLTAMSVGVASFRGNLRFHWLDVGVVAAAAYLGGRISYSVVWDLAKEDLLLIALSLVSYWTFRLPRQSPIVVFVLCVTVSANAMAFLCQKSGLDISVPIQLVSDSAAESKSFGLFKDYGALGSAMAVSGVVLLSFSAWSTGSTPLKRITALAIALVALVITFSSGSRSAAVSVAVAGALLIMVSWVRAGYLSRDSVKRVRLLVVSVGTVATLLVTALAITTFVDRDDKLSATGVASEVNVRSDYWGMALEQSLASPVIGTGARSYSYEALKCWEGSLSSIDASPEFAHNEYLQTLGDYGLVGLILLLFVLLSHWCSALKMACSPPVAGLDWQRGAGLVGLTVVMVHSFTDFPLRLPFNMFLAAMCLAWCVPAREERSEVEGQRDSRIRDRGMALVLILLSCVVVIFAGREVWAAAPLLEVRQAREDGAWSPVGHEDTLAAYELANERSPDFRRSQRIGQIYHLLYEKGDASALAQAVSFYKESLERHPFNPVPMLNLAKLSVDEGLYDDAKMYYDLAEPWVSARDAYFEYYVHRAKLSIAQGEAAYSSGDITLADQYLKTASLELKKAKSDWKVRLPMLRDCYVARVRMAVESDEYRKADDLWRETQSQTKSWILENPDAMVYHVLGHAYLDAASKEWKRRDPLLAKELYSKSKQFYLADKRVRKNVLDVERDTQLGFVEQALSILKEGGF